jgi:hypothetical protein
VGSEGASPDAERKKSQDSRPPPAKDNRDGTAAAAGMPTGQSAAAGRAAPKVQAKSVVGAADDQAERHADQAADRVMRMPDPVVAPLAQPTSEPSPAPARAVAPAAAAPVPAAPAPPVPSAPAPVAPGAGAVRRVEDPATQQKVPGTPTVKPVAIGSAGGSGPDTTTPAGPAPLVSPPLAAGARPAESGTPAPEPEPPAPEGEAPARETPPVSPELQEYLDASRGKGAPLPEAVRGVFEAKFQRPFNDVRIHDDAGADNAARSIDALAFTRGNDIYFRSGAYDPVTAAGKRLLAHELAHVVQQRPGVNRKVARQTVGPVLRRQGSAAGAKKSPAKGPTGKITDKTISIDKLTVPKFKVGRSGAPNYVVRLGSREDNPTKQASVWRNKAKANVTGAVTARIAELKVSPGGQTGEPGFYLKLTGQDFFLIGTEASLANDIRVPVWDKAGKRRSFDIDHKREAQLGGLDETPPGNLWLLDSSMNRSAGSTIKQNIDQSLHNFLTITAPTLGLTSIPSEKDVRDPANEWTLQFLELTGHGPDVTKDDFWELDDLKEKASLLKHFEFASLKDVERLRGSKTSLSIFDRVSGGGVREVPRTGDVTPVSGWNAGMFRITEIAFAETDRAQGSGRLRGQAFDDKGPIEKSDFKVPIKKLAGVEWGGVATPGAIDYWKVKAFSPLSFPEPSFDVKKGIVGRALIKKPSLKLLENVEFAVVLDGDIAVQAQIFAGDLALPGPFKVSGGSMTVTAGLSGVQVSGDIYFEIDKLAKGRIGAAAKASHGSQSFALDGELEFDTKMFTEAKLGVSYIDGVWGVEGKLAVGPNHVKGIKSASVKVAVKDDTVSATGEFEPSLKGIQKGTLGFLYSEAKGMEITGEILIGQGIPGIKSGKLAATIKEGPDKHSLSGDLTLEPSIPGLTGSVTGKYADGAFLVDAQLGYEKGFAKGTVHVGVTNQPIGADGKPAGEPKPDGSLVVYGEGSVTLQLTPWLAGTVGLKLSPDGQIEVSGEVALPPTFTVFDEKKVEKELLSIHVDIPIIGVAVAGQRIGIFATIGGSLKADAGIGPGQLRDVALKVTYNPAKPEATTVTGHATFAIPAHAGLRLTVEGAVGAGIPVVSAKAGLQVFGEIGVAGEASAASTLTWTPTAGVVLDARGEIFVEPKFKFGIDAFVDVSADLWVTTIELYHQTWHLAAFEYGSNLRFGLALPVHYESGKPFDISFDQIQWTYPHLEPKELIGGLVKQIVG